MNTKVCKNLWVIEYLTTQGWMPSNNYPKPWETKAAARRKLLEIGQLKNKFYRIDKICSRKEGRREVMAKSNYVWIAEAKYEKIDRWYTLWSTCSPTQQETKDAFARHPSRDRLHSERLVKFERRPSRKE